MLARLRSLCFWLHVIAARLFLAVDWLFLAGSGRAQLCAKRHQDKAERLS